MNRPRSFCPKTSACSSPAATAAAGSSVSCGSQVPMSQTITSAAVLPARDDALELQVLDRVVLDVHRDPPDAGIERWAPGHRPARQYAVDLEPQVVVQPGCAMPLHHEPPGARLTRRRWRAFRLGG